MTSFQRIAELADVPDGGRKTLAVGGREITILRRGERVFALWNRCPHANGRLGDGEWSGGEITCPLHRWKFDLATGRTRRDPRLRATVYEARVAGGTIEVALPEPGPSAVLP